MPSDQLTDIEARTNMGIEVVILVVVEPEAAKAVTLTLFERPLPLLSFRIAQNTGDYRKRST